MKLCLFVVFSLCCFFGVVFGSSSSESNNNNLSASPNPIEHLEGLVSYFKAAEQRNREQEKLNEELKEQIKSLTKQFEEFKNDISEDRGVWLLTPPVRGPPGKQGEKGEIGQTGGQGNPGSIGPKGERGQVGPEGQPGQKGEPGSKGERGLSAPQSITSCSDAMGNLPAPRSQKQTIYPHGNRTSLEVLCDFEVDGGGWTIIQKRSRGPKHDFNRTWNEYSSGFGSISGNFWMGLDSIHALTKNGDQELRIELEDFEGGKKYSKYSSFSVSDASDFYRLSLSGFSASSTAGDSMINPSYGDSNFLSGMGFTTKDKDNDNITTANCADYYSGGGWWYKSGCTYSNLNGGYFEKGETSSHKGILWNSWRGYSYSLAKSEMKIRNRK